MYVVTKDSKAANTSLWLHEILSIIQDKCKERGTSVKLRKLYPTLQQKVGANLSPKQERVTWCSWDIPVLQRHLQGQKSSSFFLCVSVKFPVTRLRKLHNKSITNHLNNSYKSVQQGTLCVINLIYFSYSIIYSMYNFCCEHLREFVKSDTKQCDGPENIRMVPSISFRVITQIFLLRWPLNKKNAYSATPYSERSYRHLRNSFPVPAPNLFALFLAREMTFLFKLEY